MDPIRVIAEDLVLVDWGPMTLTVSAWADDRPRPVMAAQAAAQALKALAVLADFQNLLKKPQHQIPKDRPLPEVVGRAVAAVRQVSAELTPLAAVAGAAADEVAEAAMAAGADRVIVNNGGDIALRLAGSSQATVGLKPPGGGELTARLKVRAGDGLGGVASSGWQGRSFSPGVADLVCVWAETGAMADAAATFLAGRCDVDSPAVERRPARELDPQTDLGEKLVVTKVGPLEPEQSRLALEAGLAAARELLDRGVIAGCLIQVQQARGSLDPLGLLAD